MKILISDKSSPACAEVLREAGHTVDEKFGISPDEVGYIKMAADMGLGTNELSKLNIKNINL